MKQILSLSLAILVIAANLSATPARAQPGCDVSHPFVLMLGVGY